MSKKIVVVGSGFGGLGIAIRLQARGFDVTIMEKNAMIGGHAYQLKKDGYTFDMGPSLITAPDIIRNVFTAAGKKMEDYLDLFTGRGCSGTVSKLQQRGVFPGHELPLTRHQTKLEGTPLGWGELRRSGPIAGGFPLVAVVMTALFHMLMPAVGGIVLRLHRRHR